ncbi:HEAT repeat domain-containing protein [Parapedobacter koreensis]|uniref:Putative membrane-bound dehydrogenase domain-containing protein n=1 Tax=Parapedobacter koreensis TaxID=332977 RepID=A0A1H7G0I0_9SPHI|nr:HEAT repeat domain-containing protein [Parapedobacter koreensis]SEK29185.1 putative membrane-bound dehydrogenase domain-containing protein [Parapedobacter koreensis]
MNKTIIALIVLTSVWSCRNKMADLPVKEMDPAETAQLAATLEERIHVALDSGFTLKLWGIDSLVISPVTIDIDDQGRLFYTTTDRQKNSEFDIRGHRDWEIPSISLQTVEDRQDFLRRELSPENSARNTWLADLNGDGSHDWRDLTVQKEKVYRIEDISGDGVADRSQLVVDDFHEEVTDVAGGIFADGDNLYIAVAPDLWRMTDKNGDGIPDEKTSISHGYGIHIGFSGHGMSGVKMGPDGRLYWQIGDIGFNGTGPDGQKWEYPNCGVIARSNPDGSDFEVFAYGLRNTHQFVFDEYGNIISEDNDGDHPGEKERLVYIVNGSDAGWRSNWQYGKYSDPDNNSYKVWMDEQLYLPRFEGQAAYITPCISNFVSGPTGLVYNPGTALSPAYKNTFFVAEFVGNPSNSGIHSFKLNPKGATFELGDHKKVLGGILATGLDFGPDGALYVADWIDGWGTHDYGRIWKMDHEDTANQAIRQEVKTLLAAGFGKKEDTELGKLLRHEDMRIRQKAQFALVKHGKKGLQIFQQVLGQADHQLARIHAIWGIGQLARQDQQQAAVLLPLLKDNDAEIRAQAAKWLGDIRYPDAGAVLIPLLADANSRVRFFAAEALGRIQYEPAITPIITLLEGNNDEDAYLRHAGTLALARIGKAEPVAALANSSSRALRIAAVVTLRRMGHPDITRFLQDQDEFVVTEAARAINDDLSIEDALPALADLLNKTPFTNEALVRRIINANLRVGKPANLQNLIRYAERSGHPTAMRSEAIEALSTWAKPSVIDRVDGRYRGAVARDVAELKNQTAGSLIILLADRDLSVQLSAAKAVNKLGIKQASAVLLAGLKQSKDAAMRVACLQALIALEDPQQEQAIKLALADREKSVRVAGLDLLENMAIPQSVMVNLLADVIATKTTEEKQAAIITLGKMPLENAAPLFNNLLDNMENGRLNPDVYLELGEAIDSTHAESLIARYKAISSQSAPDELMASYASALHGGNPERGGRIFFQHAQAQCMKCHAYDDRGGNAGPRLNGVGKRLSREQLLESLINPSARLASGYGMITLELKDGKTTTGIFVEETNTSIKIKEWQGPDHVIPLTEVAKKTFSPSSMIDMKGVLSTREIRDVVSFLATLTEGD